MGIFPEADNTDRSDQLYFFLYVFIDHSMILRTILTEFYYYVSLSSTIFKNYKNVCITW